MRSLRYLNGGTLSPFPAEAKQRHFVPIQELIKIDPVFAAKSAHKKAVELALNEEDAEQLTDIYIRCANILGSNKSLQVITVDEDPSNLTPIEEILEIFVRVNSGGLVLQKSDLLMSLLDLTWNDIQPELQTLQRDINTGRPFSFSRDDMLKSLLLADGAETRFDRLVADRKQVETLAQRLPAHIKAIKRAWEKLGVILMDDCKINSERFFRGGHNAFLPFVLFLSQHEHLSNDDRRNIVIGVYLSVMSGIFSGAEARMGAFAKKRVASALSFPLHDLIALVKREYGIKSLDDLLRRHLDLALNIAHGGITLDKNPDELQRDHIFPKSQLEKAGYGHDKVNHYANFHFLRGADNLNKLDKPPHEWFRRPGSNIQSYSEQDLQERLLTWDDLEPGQFETMIERRGKKIREKAEQFFSMPEAEFNALFADNHLGSADFGSSHKPTAKVEGIGLKADKKNKWQTVYSSLTAMQNDVRNYNRTLAQYREITAEGVVGEWISLEAQPAPATDPLNTASTLPSSIKDSMTIHVIDATRMPRHSGKRKQALDALLIAKTVGELNILIKSLGMDKGYATNAIRRATAAGAIEVR
jgi:hypothetical protein